MICISSPSISLNKCKFDVLNWSSIPFFSYITSNQIHYTAVCTNSYSSVKLIKNKYKPLALFKVNQHLWLPFDVADVQWCIEGGWQTYKTSIQNSDVSYLHFWNVIYSNSGAVLLSVPPHPSEVVSARHHGEDSLENNLVFEATAEVFVWEDDWVEYNHLRRDVYVTTWGEKEGCD